MATTLSFNNDDKIVNAILEMIRLQKFDVKDKIQKILTNEVNEERTKQAVRVSSQVVPSNMKDLRGILADDGRTYDEMRNEYLNEKYGL